MAIFLTPRQRQILASIVQNYVTTAEPVGSKTIRERTTISYSPATIRHEMAVLEENGLLDQPHTSAGRIPSERGYRFYVEELMGRPRLPKDGEAQIFQQLDLGEAVQMEALLDRASRLLSQLSQMVAFISLPTRDGSPIRSLHLLALGDLEAMAVVVASNGLVDNILVKWPKGVSEDQVQALNGWLGQVTRGIPYHQLAQRLAQVPLPPTLSQSAPLVEALAHALAQTLKRNHRLFLAGTSGLLREPEFQETPRAQSLLALLEEEDRLGHALAELRQGSSIMASIGHENRDPALHPCSLVAATYTAGDGTSGVIAVLGPTRMHYNQAFAAAEAVATHLSRALSRLYGA